MGKLSRDCTVYVLMDRDSQLNSNTTMSEVFETLATRGFVVDFGIAEEVVTQPDTLKADHDLYIIKSNTELSLSLAGVMHSQGACMINPYLGCITAKDKIVTSRLLRSAGIPAPSSWVTGRLMLLRDIVMKTPVVIKPHRGHRGGGVRLIRNMDELIAVPQPRSPVLIQEFIESKSEELKVYVVRDEVFAVRRQPLPLGFYPLEEQPSQPGRPCSVSPEVREISVRCGQVLGLGLYGLDIVEGSDGPKVVDVNAFPSYRGVPTAAPPIANYIAKIASREFDHVAKISKTLRNLHGFRMKEPASLRFR